MKRKLVGLSIVLLIGFACDSVLDNESSASEANGTILVAINGSSIDRQTYPIVDLGQKTIGENIPNLVVTVTNTATESLFVSNASLFESNRYFGLQSFTSGELEAGDSLEFEIVVNTDVHGKASSRVVIDYAFVDNTAENSDEDLNSHYEFAVKADINYPIFNKYIDGNKVESGYYIGSVAENVQLASDLRIENFGAGDLIVTGISLSGPNRAEFEVDQDFPLRIASDEFADVAILFESITGTGTKYATIGIASNSLYLRNQYIDIALDVN